MAEFALPEADLPTLNHWNLVYCFKKTLQKPGDWDLKPEDFQNMSQIKPKTQISFVMVFFTLFGF